MIKDPRLERSEVLNRTASVALAAAGLGLLTACGGRAEAPAAGARPAATVAPAATAEADPRVFLGRWLRSDASYTIEVLRVGEDGSVEARYFNPKPIHVSRALWKSDGRRPVLFVEMTDAGYPGNYYELAYDPGSDALVGRYNHLGLNEVYEVAFSRAPAAPE